MSEIEQTISSDEVNRLMLLAQSLRPERGAQLTLLTYALIGLCRGFGLDLEELLTNVETCWGETSDDDMQIGGGEPLQ